MDHGLCVAFPANIKEFPRTAWGTIFQWPELVHLDLRDSIPYAAREASLKVAAALQTADVALTHNDVAVAVFDKVLEINEYLRMVRAHYDKIWDTSEAWLSQTERMTRWAYKMASTALKNRPDDVPDEDYVVAFIQHAFPYIWDEQDSLTRVVLPEENAHLEKEFVGPYLPDLDNYAYPECIVYNGDTSKIFVRWKDQHGNIVPHPEGEPPLPDGYFHWKEEDDNPTGFLDEPEGGTAVRPAEWQAGPSSAVIKPLPRDASDRTIANTSEGTPVGSANPDASPTTIGWGISRLQSLPT